LTGRIGGERRTFEFPAELASTDRGLSYDFVERVWAMRRVGHIIDEIDLRGQNKELIDELVSLSTKYGIMTPYTSFLADERVPLHAGMANSALARDNLGELQITDGASGVNQRGAKRYYQDAARPSEPDFAASPTPSPGGPATPGRSRLGGAGGMGGGMGTVGPRSKSLRADVTQSRTGEEVARLAAPAAEAEGKASVAPSVRQLGAKTFYYKDGHWIDSTVKPEDEAKATVIEQFSDAFFRLARTQKAELNQYLTFAEPVTVNLDGQIYRFEMAKP
jgi:Ca-activated chloride channel family protein